MDNVYRKANGTEKGGDDYPIRIYVMFEYDPRQADLMEKMRYAAIMALYGKYPPHRSLNYVWAIHFCRRVCSVPQSPERRMFRKDPNRRSIIPAAFSMR